MGFIKRYILFCVFVLVGIALSAQKCWVFASLTDNAPKEDSLCCSILTCTAGKDLYAKFGHTALRIQNCNTREDWVFNYGCFNYHADNFVFKFLLGQTDYLLEAEPFNRFIQRYGYMGNGVQEQVLNLTQEEANRLLGLLRENLQPQNQEYRYSWLYDNCTERARDMVEKAIDGKVIYARKRVERTIRQMLRECLQTSPWVCFGIDMILGEEIDHPTEKRVQMFLPAFYSEESTETFIIKRDGHWLATYVLAYNTLLNETNEADTPSWLSPFVLFLLVLAAAMTLFNYELKHQRYIVWFDVLLHALQGIAGCLVAFLFFFSSHPAVDSNWLVIIFNPIPLFYAGWLVVCQRTGRKNWLSYANLAVLLGFFVIMLTCSQSFHSAMYLVVLSLLVRALSQAHFTYHRQS